MNFGELVAKGSALFLKKKLSAVQAVYDAAPAGEKAAFQASVSGAWLSAGLPTTQLTRMTILGNSIFASNTNWPMQMSLRSGGRIAFVRNLGVSGNTSAQVLARVGSVPDAAVNDLCLLQEGTNDAYNNVSAPTYSANMRAIISTLHARLIKTGITSPPPLDPKPSEAERLRIVTYKIALDTGARYFDPFLGMYDEAGNGCWAAGFGDAIKFHPVPAQEVNAGAVALAQLYDHASLAPLPRMQTNPYGIWSNALFLTDSNADDFSDGWADYGSATAKVSKSRATRTGTVGKIQKFTGAGTAAGNAADTYIAYKAASLGTNGLAIGNSLLIVGKLSITAATNVKVGCYLTFEGTGLIYPVQLEQIITVAEKVFSIAPPPIPAGCTAVALNVKFENINAGAWSGEVELSEVQGYNMTLVP